MGKFKNTLDWLEGISLKELKGIQMLVMISLVGVLFGVYWYLDQKKVGMALLLVHILILAGIFILERGKREQMTDEKTKQDEEQEDEDSEEEVEVKGLPNAKEYEKRAEKALCCF